eukprot:CAMPEP_0172181686 /NCGR_PEP_ID=MMETSP1050-20130122/17961_1 /TAXON_ID=233186 /ORGANISM="Cryptomonas curvata, Strain CCAP979/52" /LENGTH=305 /DNA_ID=CAMNT_0012855007 /DNA_START=244 /DNA_END=1158 /DNA_ORIENTATION=-
MQPGGALTVQWTAGPEAPSIARAGRLCEKTGDSLVSCANTNPSQKGQQQIRSFSAKNFEKHRKFKIHRSTILNTGSSTVETTRPLEFEGRAGWNGKKVTANHRPHHTHFTGDVIHGGDYHSNIAGGERRHDWEDRADSRTHRLQQQHEWTDHQEGQSLLEDLRDLRSRAAAGAPPGLDHFNSIMNKCAGSVRCATVGMRGVQAALEVLSLMQACGVVPDAATYDRLLEACAGAALLGSQAALDQGVRVLDLMRELGVAPGLDAFNLLLHAILTTRHPEGKLQRLGPALALVAAMRDVGLAPHVSS